MRTSKSPMAINEIILRREAKARGMKHYFTGLPCCRNHLSVRDTKGGNCLKCQAEYYLKNCERIKLQARAYATEKWKSDREGELARKRRNRASAFANNPDLYRSHFRNQRARKRAAEGFHTADDVQRIRLAQGNRCAYCKIKLGRSGHLDHINPLAKGGSNWPANLQWLCASCNHRKNAKDPIEFAQHIGMLL